MNTSFKPSEFDKQAAASLDMIDEQAAAERVQRILHPEPQGARSQAQAGPTLTPAPQTQLRASDDVEWATECEVCHKPIVRRGRNRLSNCGHMRMSGGGWVAKDAKPKAPADPDEIVLRLTFAEARAAASGAIGEGLSTKIQDQIIGCLQKRLEALTKSK